VALEKLKTLQSDHNRVKSNTVVNYVKLNVHQGLSAHFSDVDLVVDKGLLDTILTGTEEDTAEKAVAYVSEVFNILRSPGGVFLLVSHSPPEKSRLDLLTYGSPSWRVEVAQVPREGDRYAYHYVYVCERV
jgi:hypothetical protein